MSYNTGSANSLNQSFGMLEDEAGSLPDANRPELSEAELYQHTISNEVLPELTFLSIVDTEAYTAYTDTLPANICFHVKVKNASRVSQIYPTVTVGQFVRLYYPDYQSFGRFVQEGLVNVLGIPSRENIVHFKVVATRLDNSVTGVFGPNEGEWNNALVCLRARGIGGKVGEGLGSSHKVKLFVLLA